MIKQRRAHLSKAQRTGGALPHRVGDCRAANVVGGNLNGSGDVGSAVSNPDIFITKWCGYGHSWLVQYEH